jgi:branched-chain amino acid transport system ATP-binding protein
MLKIENLRMSFGSMMALNDCSFEVKSGSITGIIGPNGAGKSTLFNCISGVLKPTSGKILFESEHESKQLQHLKPFQIARLGIGRTFQLNRVFKRMTALENLLVVDFDRERARELLELSELGEYADHEAGKLSIGQQRLLEIARAFMLNPKMVLLDEPTAGVNPKKIESLAEEILRFKETQNATFAIVEHNLKFIMKMSDHMVVLNAGDVLASGTPDEIKKNDAVIDAYLGRHHDQN